MEIADTAGGGFVAVAVARQLATRSGKSPRADEFPAAGTSSGTDAEVRGVTPICRGHA